MRLLSRFENSYRIQVTPRYATAKNIWEHLRQFDVDSADYGGHMPIKARASDWHPDNPRIRPSVWSGPVILTVIVAIALIVAVGVLVNGNGMPFLS